MDWKGEEQKALLLDTCTNCTKAQVIFIWLLPLFVLEVHIFSYFSYTVKLQFPYKGL